MKRKRKTNTFTHFGNCNRLKNRTAVGYWLATGRAWYRLVRAAPEYHAAGHMNELRSRVDLAARAVQLMLVKPAIDIEEGKLNLLIHAYTFDIISILNRVV